MTRPLWLEITDGGGDPHLYNTSEVMRIRVMKDTVRVKFVNNLVDVIYFGDAEDALAAYKKFRDSL